MPDRIVRVVIAGDSAGGVRALRQTAVAAKETSAAVDGTAVKMGKFSSSLASFAKKGAFGVLGGAGIGGFEAVKSVISLQKQMEMLKTQTGASQGEVDKMTKGVIRMAASVGTSPQQLALGLYHVESAGLRGAKALSALRVAAEGAKIGGANLEDVTNGLNAAIVSGIRGSQDYSKAMGILNSTVGAGDMKMQDLSEALGTGVLASAKIAGLSLKQLGGALATLGDNNIRGADAGTLMKSTIRVMAQSSSAGMKVLGTIGLAQGQLADDMHKGGLIKAFIDLKAHMAGLDSVQQGLLLTRAFGGRQATGVQILLTQMDRLKQKTKQVGDGAGSFGSDWKATQKTVSFQIDQVKAAMQGLADTIGGKLLPVTGSILTWLLKNKRTIKDLGEAVLIAGAAYAVFKGAMMAGAAATAIATFATGGWADAFWALNAAMYANPIGLVIAAVALLAGGLYLLYTRSSTVRNAMKDMWSWMKHAAQDAINFVIRQINRLIDAYNAVSGFVGNVTGGVLGGGHMSHVGGATFANPGKPTDRYAAAIAKNQKAKGANAIQQLTGIRPSDGHSTVPLVNHVHVHLDSRQIAESVARTNLQLAARR